MELSCRYWSLTPLHSSSATLSPSTVKEGLESGWELQQAFISSYLGQTVSEDLNGAWDTHSSGGQNCGLSIL